MTCPSCASSIPDESKFCPQCAHVLSPLPASGPVTAEFTGKALPTFGWSLLAGLGTLLILPSPWTGAAAARWFYDKVRFSDGTSIKFMGTGRQIAAWMIFYSAIAIGFQIAINVVTRTSGTNRTLGFGPLILVTLMYYVVIVALMIPILRWVIGNLALSSGPPLTFHGTYGELLWRYLLIAVSVYSIIGWAWVAVSLYRYMARSTKGEGTHFDFLGKGHQVLWRTLVMMLGCTPIVTIPWMIVWLMRWMVSNMALVREASAPSPQTN